MRIWLVVISEPLPSDGADVRLLRMGMLGETLARRGHDVVLWTSAFDHNRRLHRAGPDDREIAGGLRVRLIRSPIAYSANVSVRRLINHHDVARRARRAFRSAPAPDVIVSALPTPELSLAAVDYASPSGIPIVLDARDMWPDIIVDVIPPAFRAVLAPATAHLRRTMRAACRRATAITGITPEFVQWALGYAARPQGPLDVAFPLVAHGLDAEGDVPGSRVASRWGSLGVGRDGRRLIVCFFGNVGRDEKYEWDIFVDAVRGRSAPLEDVQFVICGAGEGMSALRERTRGLDSFVFPGWVGRAEIAELIKRSAIGLVPYRNRPDFLASYPNKAVEYLSAGLPILSSLDGALGALIRRSGAGFVVRTAAGVAAALSQLRAEPGLRDAMAARAAAVGASHFWAPRINAEFADHVERVARSTGRLTR